MIALASITARWRVYTEKSLWWRQYFVFRHLFIESQYARRCMVFARGWFFVNKEKWRFHGQMTQEKRQGDGRQTTRSRQQPGPIS